MATHFVNAVNLLFPLGERFFIKSVARYSSWAASAEQAESVRGFLRQEAQHAVEHEHSHAVLVRQGYDIQSFLSWYGGALAFLDRWLPPSLKLAATAAGEHFTATLAEQALRGPFLAHADPAMRDLLLWHAAEEIEHKSVVYDLSRRVDPSYVVRVAGLTVAASALAVFWFGAAYSLIRQDRLPLTRLLHEVAATRAHYRLERDVFARAILEYLGAGFHPHQIDNMDLAVRYLAATSMDVAIDVKDERAWLPVDASRQKGAPIATADQGAGSGSSAPTGGSVSADE